MNVKFGSSEAKGMRENMEDRIFIESDIQTKRYMFAIYDGHGGYEVAELAKKVFSTEIWNYFQKYGSFSHAIMAAMYLDFDDKLSKTSLNNVGSTATTLFIDAKKGKLYIANLADTECIVITNFDSIFGYKTKNGYTTKNGYGTITTLHNYSNLSERERVVDNGGFWINERVNGNLNISRAFGDFDYKSTNLSEQQLISASPSFNVFNIKQSCIIVLASDGLWNFIDKSSVCKYITDEISQNPNINLNILSNNLVKLALINKSSDNISIVLIKTSF